MKLYNTIAMYTRCAHVFMKLKPMQCYVYHMHPIIVSLSKIDQSIFSFKGWFFTTTVNNYFNNNSILHAHRSIGAQKWWFWAYAWNRVCLSFQNPFILNNMVSQHALWFAVLHCSHAHGILDGCAHGPQWYHFPMIISGLQY